MHLLFMASFFKSKGYCVFALNHGAFRLPVINGMDKMENSAQQVSDFTDKVLRATGANKVDLLGYSAGTMVAQYYMKRLNGALKVEKHAGIAPIHYGTTFQNVSTVLKSLSLFDGVKEVISPICESCHQVVTNSTFINDLYADGDAVPGVQYLMVATIADEFVTPYTNGFLRSLGPNVHNQLLQDWCPNDLTGHPILQADRKCIGI
ncbi:hypothetical protein BGZ68_009131 [Mortierella alpina]|nr:hypothetical protein BGZ68_009131 [Mortierella alpina]